MESYGNLFLTLLYFVNEAVWMDTQGDGLALNVPET